MISIGEGGARCAKEAPQCSGLLQEAVVIIVPREYGRQEPEVLNDGLNNLVRYLSQSAFGTIQCIVAWPWKGGGHTLYQVAHEHDRMNRTTAIKHLKRFNSSSLLYILLSEVTILNGGSDIPIAWEGHCYFYNSPLRKQVKIYLLFLFTKQKSDKRAEENSRETSCCEA